MISCEKQKQPRQSSSSGDFAIIIKMKIRIKPEVSEMMTTFRPIWIGLISPYANYLWPYDDSRQRKKNCHGTHIIEFWEKAAHIFVQIKASHVSIVSLCAIVRRNWKRNSRWIKCHINDFEDICRSIRCISIFGINLLTSSIAEGR